MNVDTHEVAARARRRVNLRSRRGRSEDRTPASVFVVGTMFSGSTLIGRDVTTRVAGAHYVGELNNLTQFPGFSHEDAGKGCGPCLLLGERCPHFTDELLDGVSYDDIPGMHRRLARSLDASAVIDGSKLVAWLRTAVEQRRGGQAGGPPPGVIVTARNPIAFAISLRNRTGEPLWQGAAIWRDTYVDALRTVNTYGLPNLVLRYEDHMADREGSLERLAGFLHLPLDAEPDNTRLHDTGGNWSSFVPYVGREHVDQCIERLDERLRGEAEKFVRDARAYWNDDKPREDTRWHRSLNPGEANAVLSTPGLADVASLLGYNVAETIHLAVRPAR